MVIVFVFMDILIVMGIAAGIYVPYHRRKIANDKKESISRRMKYDKEVFHNPDILLKNPPFNDHVQCKVEKVEYESSCDSGDSYRHYDGNDLIRDRARNKEKIVNDDLAMKTVTPFEHGGMNLNNNNCDSTNYLNL